MKCETLYLCDPEKNVECGKHSCYAENGPCCCTHNKDYALCIENAPVIVMTKEDQEACSNNALNFIAQLEIATKVALKRYNIHQ